MLSHLLLLALTLCSADGQVSSFAGETSSFLFPPNGATVAATDTANFPDGSQVGFPGPTPTGDEAGVLATAPAIPKVDSAFPLVEPPLAGAPDAAFSVIDHWGNLSPMKSVDSAIFGLPDASPLIPDGCALNQVHILHRHGARYPTSGSAPAAFAAKVHATAVNATFNATGPLAFLNTWTYKLGAEILTPFGRSQMFDLGVGARVKYGELLKGFADLPVWRTTSEERMLDSALHFAAGFFGVQSFQDDYHQLIVIEQDGFNNTLAPFTACPNSNSAIGGFGGVQSAKWINQYLNGTVSRLQADLPGFNLTISDVFGMQQLCAYETVALGFSSFCGLFTETEWRHFEYANDLSFWYGNGPGQPTNAAQGIGYVQETIARLTQTPITTFDTTINGSLANNITFPLSQPIFVDATHDTVISAIVTAFNFASLAASGPLPTDHIPKNRSWVVTRIAPFGSNLVGQVLSCPSSSAPTHIRWILNDGVLPLTGIKNCPEDKNGLCPLDTFISSMKDRIAEVDFQFDCFANYTIPNPDTVIDGRFPAALRNETS